MLYLTKKAIQEIEQYTMLEKFDRNKTNLFFIKLEKRVFRNWRKTITY